MKYGGTHLAHKLEHAVDMDSGAVVAVTMQEVTGGDGKSLQGTVAGAHNNLEQVSDGTQEGGRLTEVVLDSGYHRYAEPVYLNQHRTRSYVAEPKRGRRRWEKPLEESGRRLQRKRGELPERTSAHYLESGALRWNNRSATEHRAVLPAALSPLFYLLCDRITSIAANHLGKMTKVSLQTPLVHNVSRRLAGVR